ncbi:type I restriction enzyme HsdR N-terminal domain-containing protein [Desulfosediminicola flagellatus]|uniref:type I restriction enzyme HsdR N-terminal domain-containing protein n=1 Tax=Desulfosediminicola flagellatus TaxID=2569541 RepID=UPI0010AD75E7|nr:type I restriction enzyme HsdR N-terminal domain-containing protein [Desulfosediminicola flagellatus]
MPPKPYYDINPDASLFGRKVEKPEEKIRQWMLFELMSTYGIHINNIEIERVVKVGTRNHFADIVILREGAPYAVIECKRWENRKSEIGMQQAISYADANTIKARYAAFTNGDIWEVKTKIGEEWVDIPDLPKCIDDDYLLDLDVLISSMNHIMPLLYWMNQEVPPSSARTYISCMQDLFNGYTFPLSFLDDELLFGTDNLLRVIWSKGGSGHPDYLHNKLVAACISYSEFLSKHVKDDVDNEWIKGEDLRQLTIVFKHKFEKLAQNSAGLKCEEVLHIRFIATLFQYLSRQISSTKHGSEFQTIPAVLTTAFQELVGYLFQVHLHVRFPDPILEESSTDLRVMCDQAWGQFEKGEIESERSIFFTLRKCFLRN